jgi:hypothetical protein
VKNFSFGARKPKLPAPGDMIVKYRAPDFDAKKFHERAKGFNGTKEVPADWAKEISTLSAEDACRIIRRIMVTDIERIDGVVHPGENRTDPSVTHMRIDPSEKLVRILVVLGCLAPPLAGKMPTADSDGVFFESYNRLSLSYLAGKHPALDFEKD